MSALSSEERRINKVNARELDFKILVLRVEKLRQLTASCERLLRRQKAIESIYLRELKRRKRKEASA